MNQVRGIEERIAFAFPGAPDDKKAQIGFARDFFDERRVGRTVDPFPDVSVQVVDPVPVRGKVRIVDVIRAETSAVRSRQVDIRSERDAGGRVIARIRGGEPFPERREASASPDAVVGGVVIEIGRASCRERV